MRAHVILIGLLACSCSESDGSTKPVSPGPVELRSADHMREFLCSGRFSAVGSDATRRTSWWEFRENGTFAARLEASHLSGSWTANETELNLTELEVRTGPDGELTEPADRRLRLQWVDGKLNIEIDGVQYRKYGQ